MNKDLTAQKTTDLFSSGRTALKRHVKLPRVEFAFYTIWGFYLLASTILGSRLGFTYDLSLINKVIRFAVLFALLGLFLLERRFKKGDLIRYMVFFVLIFLIELANTNSSFLVYMLFILTAQKIDFDRFLRFDIKVRTIAFFSVVILCLLGFIENRASIFYAGTASETLKSAYGFGHPNTFTIYFIIILVEWLVIRYKKMRWYEWAANLACLAVVYEIGGGRTSSYAYAGIFLLFVIARVFPGVYRWKLTKLLFVLATPAMAVFSFVGAYLYAQGNELFVKLNQVLSSRLSLNARFLENYDITLFGQKIETVSTAESQAYGVQSSVLDNTYVRCLLVYGLVFFVLLIVFYSLFMFFRLQDSRLEFALLALFFVIIGVAESYVLNPVYNVTLFGLLALRFPQSRLNSDNFDGIVGPLSQESS